MVSERKFLAGPQNGGWELGMIRRVRIVLGFQAERAIFLIGLATFADDAGIEMNRGIELHARLRGPHFHLPASDGSSTLAARRSVPIFPFKTKL